MKVNELIIDTWETGFHSWDEVATIVYEKTGINLTGNACRKRYRRSKGVAFVPRQEKTEPTEWVVDNAENLRFSFETGLDRTPFDKLIEATGIDLDRYAVEKGSIWGTPDNPSASFRFKSNDTPTESQLEKLLDRLKHRPAWLDVKYQYRQSTPFLALFSLYDAHIGQIAHDGDVTDVYGAVLSKLVAMVENFSIGQILFPIGNDFGNIDNANHETTKGTTQQANLPWRIGVDKQAEIATWAVEFLRQYAPVHIPFVPGNHDRYSNYWLGKYLEAFFKDVPGVTFDNSHNPRKYYGWKGNAFMFVHGNEEGQNKLPLLFNTEAPTIFGQAVSRNIFKGHIHKERGQFVSLDEDFGVVQRVLPALVKTDEWHLLSGYTGTERKGIVHVFGNQGQIAEFYGRVW